MTRGGWLCTRSRFGSFVVMLLGLAVSCRNGASSEKLDAGQRRYCTVTLDGGRDASRPESGGADLAVDSRDLGIVGFDSAIPDSPLRLDGVRDSALDASALDVVSLVDARDSADGVAAAPGTGGAGGAGGISGTGGAGGTTGVSGTGGTAGGGTGGGGASGGTGGVIGPDAGPDARDTSIDVIPDARDTSIEVIPDALDTSGEVILGAPLDTSIEAIPDSPPDLAPPDSPPETSPDTQDAPPGGGTCTIGNVTSAKVWSTNAKLSDRYGLAVAPDGSRWATGVLYGANVDLGTGTLLPSCGGGCAQYSDAFLARLDPSSGRATQAFTFGDAADSEQVAQSVAVAPSGNVVVMGNYSGEIDFTLLALQGDGSAVDNVDFLAANSKSAGSPMGYYVLADGAASIAAGGPYIVPIKARNVDVGDGALYAAAGGHLPAPSNKDVIAICGYARRGLSVYSGTSTSNTGAITGTPPTYDPLNDGLDIVVFVIDALTGDVIWGQQFGHAGDQVCKSIGMDASGNVFIAGVWNGVLDFGNGHALTGSGGSVNPAMALPYVAKFDATGVCQAAQTWGSSGSSAVNGLAVDASGNVYIAGNLGGANNNPFNFVDPPIKNRGGTDAFAAKLDSSLVAQWAKSFGDVANKQSAYAIGVTSAGNVLIGGTTFTGSLEGLGLVSLKTTGSEAFLAQLSGADGSVISSAGGSGNCAYSYGGGEVQGDQQIFAISVAPTGAQADSILIGGNFTRTMALGSTTLLSPATNACNANADCPTTNNATCSSGFCVSPTVPTGTVACTKDKDCDNSGTCLDAFCVGGKVRSFISRLGP